MSSSADVCCATEPYARGLCKTHYHRGYRRGDRKPLEWTAERIIAEATPSGECLLFGTHQVTRYPQVRKDGKNATAHRVVYEGTKGPIPPRSQIHHTCANTKCVNPEHLQRASQADNVLEMLARRDYEARITELEATVASLSARVAELEGQT